MKGLLRRSSGGRPLVTGLAVQGPWACKCFTCYCVWSQCQLCSWRHGAMGVGGQGVMLSAGLDGCKAWAKDTTWECSAPDR